MKNERYLGEVVALTRTCDLGEADERAVVVDLWTAAVGDDKYMSLVFPDRPLKDRLVNTGADYKFLRSV